MKKSRIAILLAASLAATLLSGCSGIVPESERGISEAEMESQVRVNETTSPDSKWIDSELEGAIDETTATDPKTDYFTYINKDWILSQTVSNESQESTHRYRVLGSSFDKTKQRILSIIKGEDDPEAVGNVEMPEDELEHDEDLVSRFASAAGDWDTRNREGMAPLQKYIGYIEDISSIDELSDYICDTEQQNLFAIELLPMVVTTMPMDAENYYAYIPNEAALTLDKSCYSKADYILRSDLKRYREKYGYILERLGYSDDEIDRIFRNCYHFEAGLSDHTGDDTYYSNTWLYSEDSLKTISKEETISLSGSYPLERLMEIYGYDTDKFIVVNPDYNRYIGSIYNEQHLEEIKCYLIVQTVSQTGHLLDRACYDEMNKNDNNNTASSSTATDSQTSSGGGDTVKTTVSDDDDITINLIQNYLGGCLDNLYIAKYCTKEEKEDITNLVYKVIAFHRSMLGSEDWLSEDARKAAVEKLDSLKINILYPDTIATYEYLDFGDDSDLLDLVADIEYCRRGSDAGKLGKPVDRNEWDEEHLPTTTVNCCYTPNKNAICILAGYIAGDVYDINMSDEEKLANIGVTIGHEITHGFDTRGSKFDKNGNYREWWSVVDTTQFDERAKKLEQYYSAIIPYPGSSAYKGSTVAVEAIADLGGMKCALGLAKEIEGFDYEEFFENYARVWGEKSTYLWEVQAAMDMHPLNYLRCNIVVSQFDEFYDTYGIEKGDGMYTAPDERICVW